MLWSLSLHWLQWWQWWWWSQSWWQYMTMMMRRKALVRQGDTVIWREQLPCNSSHAILPCPKDHHDEDRDEDRVDPDPDEDRDDCEDWDKRSRRKFRCDVILSFHSSYIYSCQFVRKVLQDINLAGGWQPLKHTSPGLWRWIVAICLGEVSSVCTDNWFKRSLKKPMSIAWIWYEVIWARR